MVDVTPEGFLVANAVPSDEVSLLESLLEALPGYSLISSTMKQRALDTALVPDAAGVWPGQEGYTATYDEYWAACNLIGFLQAQPVVRQTSSEGTSIAVDAPNWSGLLAYYRSMSKIALATQAGPLLTSVPIPETKHVVRTDMSGRGDSYGDVDTDAS